MHLVLSEAWKKNSLLATRKKQIQLNYTLFSNILLISDPVVWIKFFIHKK